MRRFPGKSEVGRGGKESSELKSNFHRMTDVFSAEKRSDVMSRIRGKGNKKTELALIGIFKRNAVSGWRRNQSVFGKPDFVFPKWKLAVFVDGCFWHVCPKHATAPKNNPEFWAEKLKKNQARDRLVNRTLRSKGWVVLRIWEHELARKNENAVVRRIRRSIRRAEAARGMG